MTTTRGQKLIIGLIVWIPVLIMIVWSAFYVVGQYRRVVNNASVLIVDELSRRWNREVRVGSASVTPLGVAVLKDVEIAAKKKLADGRMLQVREVRIKYNVSALILNNKRAQSIDSVVVIDPRVNLVRHADGSLNVQDLLKRPPGPPGPPFMGTVEIRGGTLIFADYLAKTKLRPAVNIVQDLRGFLSAAQQPVYRFQGSGYGAKDRFRRANVIGNYNIKSKKIDLDLDSTQVAAAYWSRYFGLSKSVDVRGGTLRVIAGVHMTKSGGKTKTLLSGAAGISNASVLLPTMVRPVTNINGTAALRGQSVILSVIGDVSRSKMRAVGTINGFHNPKLNIYTSSPNADFESLAESFKVPVGAKNLKPSGRGPVSARIGGPANNLTVSVTARVPRVGVGGYMAHNAKLSGTYSRGLLNVSSAEFGLDGARVVANGSIETSGRQNVSIRGRVTGINVAKLPISSKFKIKGVGSAKFVVTGAASSPNIAARVRVAKGKFQGIPVEGIRAQVSYSGGRLRISTLEATSKSAGRLTASGVVSRNKVDLSVTGQSMNLAALGKVVGIANISGTGYFAGTIRGSVRKPTFSGTVEAFAVGFDKYKIDYAQMVFSTDMSTVTVESGVVRMFPAELKFAGSASGLGTDRIAFNVSGRVERLTVGKLADLLGRKVDVSGTLVGRLDAAGVYVIDHEPGQSPLQNTVAWAEFTLEDGSAFGYPITDASARLNLLDNRIEVNEATLTSQDAKASMGGAVMLDTGAVDLTYDITGFDLVRLHDRVGNYALLSGIASAEGHVTGTLKEPVVEVSASVNNLIINYNKFDVAEAKAVYAGGLVESASAVLKKGEQLIEAHASGYNINSNCLASATGTIKEVRVLELWNMLRASPYIRAAGGEQMRESLARMPKLTGGLLNGTFSVNGCMPRPDGFLKLAATNVGMDSRRIESITLDMKAADGVVILDEFTATAGATIVSASGRLAIESGHVQLDVNASNMDLSHLRPWLGENTPGGMMAADVTISGDIVSPSIVGSIEVKNPSFAGLTFDALRASRIEVLTDRIEFADVILASGGHQVVAQGYVPWSWSDITVPADKPMQIVARLRRQDLSVLSTFSSVIDPTKTTGTMEALLQVTGTPGNPVMNGSLSVENGTIALENFQNQFNNININVSFDGTRVVVNRFSLASSMGGSANIVPGGYIELGPGKAAQTNLQIVANGLSIAEVNALGLREEVTMQVDAGLSVTGDSRAPLVTNAPIGGAPGGITIHDTRIVFVAPEIVERPILAAPPVNPTFDVAIRIGNNVVIAPPSMTLTVKGDGSVSGSLAKPDVMFDLTIVEGDLRLATTRLTVAPDGKLYVRYAPPAGPEVRVDLQASATVTAVNSFGERDRYVIVVDASGPVSNLEVNLSSTPNDLSKEQMLAALGHVSGIFTEGETGLQNELGNILTAVGTSTIFAPVESLFVEQLGFQQFSLEYSLGQPLALYVSRRLWGNLFVSYYGYLTSDFTSANDVAYMLGLSYRMNRNYQFSMFVDDEQNGSFQIQYTQAFW
ncbi:MAG: translocation/assembly module TamB domain-containing protein [Armatimonadota bacterium]|nr:translocation/assembly module TamB [bacterium]